MVKTTDFRSPGYKWVVLSNTTIAILMASIDTSIVIISLPYILQSVLHHLPGGYASQNSAAYAIASANSFIYVIWSLMGYMLITATLLMFFGRIADLKGRVKIYNTGFAVFHELVRAQYVGYHWHGPGREPLHNCYGMKICAWYEKYVGHQH